MEALYPRRFDFQYGTSELNTIHFHILILIIKQMVHLTKDLLSNHDGNVSRGHAHGMTSLKCTSKEITSLSDDIFFESLIRIDLSKNEISSIPSSICICANLRWLNLSNNVLTDIKALECLRTLEVLNVSRNRLHGKISVGKFTKLKALVLNGNEIDSIGGLEKLTCLETLIVSQNKLSSFGGWIAGGTSIQKLSASNNPIAWNEDGKDAAYGLSKLVSMKELRLNHTGMNSVPHGLVSMRRLRILELGSNTIETFEDIKVLSSLKSIWQLNLKGNPLASVDGYSDRIRAILPQIDVLDAKRLRSKNEKYIKHSTDRLQDTGAQKERIDASRKDSTVKTVAPEEQNALSIDSDDDEDQVIQAEDFVVSSKKQLDPTQDKLSVEEHETAFNKEKRKKAGGKKDGTHATKRNKKKDTTNKNKQNKHVLHKVLHSKDVSLPSWD